MDIAKLNQIKNTLENTTVSKKEVLALLKVAGVKYPGSVFTHLKNANVISTVTRNQYRFQKEPILKAMVEAGEKEAYKEKKKYNGRYYVEQKYYSFFGGQSKGRYRKNQLLNFLKRRDIEFLSM